LKEGSELTMSCNYCNREIYGIIYDARTQAPIAGARVRIGARDGQCVPGTPDLRTGPRGDYSTAIADSGHGDGCYVFQVTCPGYRSLTGVEVPIPHPHGDKVHQSFALTPEE
jgi:hypothetical protein